MGSSSSTPVKDNQKFTIKTEAYLIGDEVAIGSQEINKAYAYMTSPAFKKRILFDLNSNFVYDKKIKIVIDSLKVQKNLKVVIEGTIKVLKKESEEERIVKSVLKDALPQYSSQGEAMPPRQKFRIVFKSGETSLTF